MLLETLVTSVNPKYALMFRNQFAIFSGFPSYILGGSNFVVRRGSCCGSLNTSLISPIHSCCYSCHCCPPLIQCEHIP